MPQVPWTVPSRTAEDLDVFTTFCLERGTIVIPMILYTIYTYYIHNIHDM